MGQVQIKNNHFTLGLSFYNNSVFLCASVFSYYLSDEKQVKNNNFVTGGLSYFHCSMCLRAGWFGIVSILLDYFAMQYGLICRITFSYLILCCLVLGLGEIILFNFYSKMRVMVVKAMSNTSYRFFVYIVHSNTIYILCYNND